MRFELIRLVLTKNTGLFATDMPRELWLRIVFNIQFTFVHRRKTYHYVPVFQEGYGDDAPQILMGRIGRPKIIKENEPPEGGLEEIRRESWTAAHIYIDPRHHEDGQKVAFEQSELGAPLVILRSMVSQINKRYDAPFAIAANPISHIDSFKSFIEQHPYDITYIQFDLNTPNMFGLRTTVDEEMRQAKDKFNAKRARIVLANEDGMQLKDNKISEIGGYALEGGGEVKAKAMNNASFSSSKTIETANVETPEGGRRKDDPFYHLGSYF